MIALRLADISAGLQLNPAVADLSNQASSKMSSIEVRVSVDGTDIFIDYGDGSCLPPNAKERRLAIRALKDAIVLLKKPTMDEICDRGGDIGDKFKPKTDRFRLRLVEK